MSTLLLSFFPLPAERRSALDVAALEVDVLDLTTLRHSGLARAIPTLRSNRWDRALFVYTPSDPLELQSIAELALALVRAKVKGVVPPHERGMQALPATYWLRAPLGMSWAAVVGLFASWRNWAEAVRLTRAPRRQAALDKDVLYLRASYGMPAVGGSVGHTSGIVNALVRSGRHVRLFAAGPPVGVTEPIAFTAVSLPPTTTYPHELNFHRYSRRYTRQVLRHVAPGDVGWIYQRYVLNDASGVVAARALGVPLVLEYNGSEVWVQRNWGRPLLLERASLAIEQAALRGADLVVTVSEPLRAEVVKAGVPSERVLFYPNCVDPHEFDPSRHDTSSRAAIRTALGVPQDLLIATFVGTFGRWHGAEVFARAIVDIIRSPDPDAARLGFLFVGEGATSAEVREILREVMPSGRIVMAGARPQGETPLTLAASDILVSPHVPNSDGSPFFGSPTKLFEYMAMSRLIVASDLDQIGRVLRGWTPQADVLDAELALLVPPGDASALAQALAKASKMTPLERAAYGTRARARALTAFTWDSQVAAIVERLDALCAGHLSQTATTTKHGAVR